MKWKEIKNKEKNKMLTVHGTVNSAMHCWKPKKLLADGPDGPSAAKKKKKVGKGRQQCQSWALLPTTKKIKWIKLFFLNNNKKIILTTICPNKNN